MDVQPIVEAQFNEAYTFKQTIAYLKHIGMKSAFRIEKDKISITQADANNTILAEWSIKTAKLIKFAFNAMTDDGKAVDLLYVGFELAELYKTTKAIQKKDSMTLLILPGDKSIYISISSSKSDGRASINIVPMLDISPELYTELKYNRSVDQPNCRIPSSDFAKLCANLSQMKCVSAAFVGYDKGLTIKGIQAMKNVAKIESFGICSDEPESKAEDLSHLIKQIQISKSEVKQQIKLVVRSREDLMTIRVPAAFIKPMSKFGAFGGSGFVSVFIEEDKPLKLLTDVGAYSELTIIIRDTKS